LPDNKYSAVILAVAHEKFKNVNIDSLRINGDNVVYDVKGFLNPFITDETL